MAKPMNPGDIVRYEEAERPLHAAIVIVLLTLFELVFVVLLVFSLVSGWKTPDDQIMQSQWLFAIFLTLGFIFMVYRRYFVADVMIVKVRNKKYEDFIDKHRIPATERD
jgi:hypothetical protein